MTHIYLAILNSHVIVIYLRFIKSCNVYVVKQKHLKLLYFSVPFSSKKTVSKTKSLLSEIVAFQNLLKNGNYSQQKSFEIFSGFR